MIGGKEGTHYLGMMMGEKQQQQQKKKKQKKQGIIQIGRRRYVIGHIYVHVELDTV